MSREKKMMKNKTVVMVLMIVVPFIKDVPTNLEKYSQTPHL